MKLPNKEGRGSVLLPRIKWGIEMKNYYTVLGVSEQSSQEEIKKAYRGLAKKYHPDTNPDGKERFEEIGKAYQVLGDEEKRKQYDESQKQSGGRFTQEKKKQTGQARQTYQRRPLNPGEGLDEQFASFFGFSPQGGRMQKGGNENQKNPVDTTGMFSSFFNPAKGRK